MLDHWQRSQKFLLKAEDGGPVSGASYWASLATAHAVLALIDIITGDRETETQQLYDLVANLENENQALKFRLRELADQLDGCNDTLRRHEQAATNEANELNELAMKYRQIHPDYEPTAAELREWEREQKPAANNDLRKSYE